MASKKISFDPETSGGSLRRIAIGIALLIGIGFLLDATLMRIDAGHVGIKVKLQPNENAAHIQKLISGTFPALWILDHAYAQYTPSTLAVSAYPFNADKNSSNFDSAKYKKDANAAWEVNDPTGPKAAAAYQALSDDLIKNLFLIEGVTTYFEAGVSDHVHGVTWTKRSELTFGDTWLDGCELPVTLDQLDEFTAWSELRYRGVVVLPAA